MLVRKPVGQAVTGEFGTQLNWSWFMFTKEDQEAGIVPTIEGVWIRM